MTASMDRHTRGGLHLGGRKGQEHFRHSPAPCARKPTEKRQELSVLSNMGTPSNFQKG